jgi:hypothetical protein
MNNADSNIEEWEIDLYIFVIKVGIIPKNNPINTDRTHNYKKPFKPSKITLP